MVHCTMRGVGWDRQAVDALSPLGRPAPMPRDGITLGALTPPPRPPAQPLFVAFGVAAQQLRWRDCPSARAG
jgi:hypothetical protein